MQHKEENALHTEPCGTFHISDVQYKYFVSVIRTHAPHPDGNHELSVPVFPVFPCIITTETDPWGIVVRIEPTLPVLDGLAVSIGLANWYGKGLPNGLRESNIIHTDLVAKRSGDVFEVAKFGIVQTSCKAYDCNVDSFEYKNNGFIHLRVDVALKKTLLSSYTLPPFWVVSKLPKAAEIDVFWSIIRQTGTWSCAWRNISKYPRNCQSIQSDLVQTKRIKIEAIFPATKHNDATESPLSEKPMASCLFGATSVVRFHVNPDHPSQSHIAVAPKKKRGRGRPSRKSLLTAVDCNFPQGDAASTSSAFTTPTRDPADEIPETKQSPRCLDIPQSPDIPDSHKMVMAKRHRGQATPQTDESDGSPEKQDTDTSNPNQGQEVDIFNIEGDSDYDAILSDHATKQEYQFYDTPREVFASFQSPDPRRHQDSRPVAHSSVPNPFVLSNSPLLSSPASPSRRRSDFLGFNTFTSLIESNEELPLFPGIDNPPW